MQADAGGGLGYRKRAERANAFTLQRIVYDRRTGTKVAERLWEGKADECPETVADVNTSAHGIIVYDISVAQWAEELLAQEPSN